MPIQIKEPPEPWSKASLEGDQSVLIESDQFRLLLNEVRRYCKREIRGRSFLISGHRGSGKTTLVLSVLERILGEGNPTDEWNRPRGRPLLVPLHGPDLLTRRKAPPVDPKNKDDKTETTNAGSANDPEHSVEKGSNSAKHDSKSKKPDENPEEPPADPAQGNNNSGQKDASQDELDEILDQILRQIMLGLKHAVAREFANRYRQSALNQEKLIDAPELAAQMELDLDGYPETRRLREYWRRGHFLKFGILHPPPQSPEEEREKQGRGAREIVALTSVCDAYINVTGEVEQTDKEIEERARHAELALETQGKGNDLLKPLMAMLTGGVVGAGANVGAGVQGGPALLAGLTTALAASAVLKHSTGYSRRRAGHRERIVKTDTSPSALARKLPYLVERLCEVGLSPIFLVDELDKIERHALGRRMTNVMDRLKKVFAEDTFFCFLTDREYYEGYVGGIEKTPYSKSYTHFTHLLFITFRPEDYHNYLRNIIVPPEKPLPEEEDESEAPALYEEEEDCQVLPYVILHSARLNPIALRRYLGRLRDQVGNYSIPPGAIRSYIPYRLELLFQLAIEIQLDKVTLRGAMEYRPEVRRFAYDALCYPSYIWSSGAQDLDLSSSGIAGFKAYLEERMKSQDEDERAAVENNAETSTGQTNRPLEVDDALLTLLLGEVREMASLLADPGEFRKAFDDWMDAKSPPAGMGSTAYRGWKAQFTRAIMDALPPEFPLAP